MDIDQIDAISLHSLAGATTETTPERLKSLVSDSTPPIYQNLLDNESPNPYLQKDISGLCYTSTPASKSRYMTLKGFKASHREVSTGTSESTLANNQMLVRNLQQDEQVYPEPLKRDSVSSNHNAPYTTPTKLTDPTKGPPSTPKFRSPLRRLSFNNTLAFPLVTPKAARQREESTVSIYDNLPPSGKENHAGLSPRSTATSQKRRPSLVRKQSDLRKKALMRNLSYKPIKKQVNISSQSVSDLATRKASAGNVSEMKHESKPYEQSPDDPKKMPDNNTPSSRELHEFDACIQELEEFALTLDKDVTTSSCEELSQIPSHPEPERDTVRYIDDDISPNSSLISHKPKDTTANRFVHQAQDVASNIPSKCDGDVSISAAPAGAQKLASEGTKRDTSLSSSFVYVTPNDQSSLLYEKSGRRNTPRFRRAPAPNLRNRPFRDLPQRPINRYVRNTPLRPRQIDIIPEEVEPGDTVVADPPFRPSVSQRMIPRSKEPRAQGLVIYDFSKWRECEVSVKRGENVTVLNMQDEDWLYIQRDDEMHEEGFVPRSYVFMTPLKGMHIFESVKKLYKSSWL